MRPETSLPTGRRSSSCRSPGSTGEGARIAPHRARRGLTPVAESRKPCGSKGFQRASSSAGRASRCQREGRRFESGLALQQFRAPSRCYAVGLRCVCGLVLTGAAGVPFGAAEVEEVRVRFLLAQSMGVHAECHLGVCVPKRVRDPAGALADGVTRRAGGSVQSTRPE